VGMDFMDEMWCGILSSGGLFDGFCDVVLQISFVVFG